MSWVPLSTNKPVTSSYYKVKATGAYSNVNGVYYDIHTDAWIHDDGTWLPVDIGAYVTHWYNEIK